MTKRVSALIGVEVLLAAAAGVGILAVAEVPIEPSPIGFVTFTIVLIGIMRLPPLYVEWRRHGSWITPTDAVYVIGLLVLGPLGLVGAVVVGEIAIRAGVAHPPLKRLFNLVSTTGGAMVGALTFAMVGGAQPLELRTWIGAVAALVVIAAWDTVMTALVLAISEHAPLRSTVTEMLRPMGITLAISVPLGLIALVLLAWSWLALLLLAPLLGLAHISTQATLRQRAERQRVQQLVRASAELASLVDASDLLARIAEQSRELVTGASAIAIALPAEGPLTARLVDDTGEHAVEDAVVQTILQLVGGDWRTRRGEVSPGALDRATRKRLPPSSDMLWVLHCSDDASALIVTVFRELLPDGADEHRADVLATFVAHAATSLANVRLHTDLQRNLEQEQTLHRRKDEFVATVSHELRTPLTSIGGAVETLRHRGQGIPPADRDRLLAVAADHTGRLRGLIDDLLLVAEAETHHDGQRREKVDIVALLDGLDDEFRPWLHERLQIRQGLSDRWVVTDGDKLRRILVHLLGNARKYAAGTTVELTVRSGPSQVVFAVSDGGPGIAAEHRDQIFERFMQLDGSSTRERGGLGLGLHLCRQLAEALDGDLQVDDNPTGGARFTLTLPLLG